MRDLELSFKFDTRALTPFRDKRITKAIAQAASRAGGDAIRRIRTTGSRKVRERKRMKAGKVREALPLVFPVSKRLNDLVWRMKVSGKAIPVIAYPGAREVRKGVSVGINRGKRKVIPSAFIAVMKSGHRGVFRRKTKGGKRLPIQELYSSTVADVFKDQDMIPSLQEEGQRVFASAFTRNLSLMLDKAKIG